MKAKLIAVDFDGTCVTYEYPKVGKDVGAVEVLKKIIDQGHKIILYTIRSGKTLDDAVRWFNDNQISLYAVNSSPGQQRWSSSKKIYAHLYIDDSALGAPLTENPSISDRPYINWSEAEILLKEWGVL